MGAQNSSPNFISAGDSQNGCDKGHGSRLSLPTGLANPLKGLDHLKPVGVGVGIIGALGE